MRNGSRETFKIYTIVHLLDLVEGPMTAAENEDYVICPNCRALVPWTPTCINCGATLPPKRRAPERREAAKGELSLEGLGVTDVSVEPEGRLTSYLLWRVRLMELLRADRVSREVFEQLYKEYVSTTLEAVERKKAFMRELFDAKIQVEDVRRKLGDKDRRRASGERATSEFLDEYSRLKSELEQLQADLSRIRFQQRSLGLVLGEGKDAEILTAVEKRFRNYLSYLPLMVTDGLLSPAMEETVRGDLKEMLTLMEAAGDEAAEVLVEEEAAEAAEEIPVDDEALLKEVSSVVKGHDDEIRRLIRAVRMKDNALILGPHGEGKTELLLQLHRRLGGIYFHCNEEVSERELVAGFNPSAFVGRNPIHLGCLMQIATGTAKGAPIAFIDAVMKLRPKSQVILFEAMNNKSFTNPVDGKLYFLPEGFGVVAASNLESVVQETPDAAFLDRFGKIILWGTTPDEAVRELLDPYGLPESIIAFLVWVKREVGRMRYLVPISVRNLIKFAQEFNRYREVYEARDELLKLAVDRMIKMRVVNVFGLREYEEAKAKIERYVWK